MMYARQDDGRGFRGTIPASIESYISRASAAAASASASAAEEEELESTSLNSDDAAASTTTTGIDLSEATTVLLSYGAGAAVSTSALGSLISSSDGSTSTASTMDSSTAATSSASRWQQTDAPSMMTTMLRTQPPWRPSWQSTATASSTSAGSSYTDSANTNPNLTLHEASHKGPNTAVIAGVVIPIVLLLAGGLVFLTCRQRRRQRAMVTDAVTTPAAAGLVEKVSHKRLGSDVQPILTTTPVSPSTDTAPQLPQLVLTSPQNPTYFTGLDTFSMHSTGTTEEPPPPYRARSVLSSRSSEQHRSGVAGIPLSPISDSGRPEPSPFSDLHAVVARTSSTRSFASTLYSSNASVYEARPARLSTGPAEYVVAGRVEDEQDRVRSPFEDPEDEHEMDNRERSAR